MKGECKKRIHGTVLLQSKNSWNLAQLRSSFATWVEDYGVAGDASKEKEEME